MTDGRLARMHQPVEPLPAEALRGAAPDAAVTLLGCLLCHDHPDGQRSVARIVETEAYDQRDPASHSYRGPTPRTAPMFGAPGTAYVYRSYGVHWCLNVTVGPVGSGAAVLLRAAVVVEGERGVRDRRPHVQGGDGLLRGPGNLTSGLDIEAARHDGSDLLTGSAGLLLYRDAYRVDREQVIAGPRVGVSQAADLPWRFRLTATGAVSRYRRSARAPSLEG